MIFSDPKSKIYKENLHDYGLNKSICIELSFPNISDLEADSIELDDFTISMFFHYADRNIMSKTSVVNFKNKDYILEWNITCYVDEDEDEDEDEY